MRYLILATLALFSAPVFGQVTIAPLITGAAPAVVLENNTSATIPAGVVTFGQPFVPGAIPKGQGITSSLPTGYDIKATNPDGSVRHAIISLNVPTMAAGARQTVTLAAGPAQSVPVPVKASDILLPGYDFEVTLGLPNSSGVIMPQVIDVPVLVTAAFANGTASTWLDDALVKEVRVSTALNPQMTATFDVRATSDGQVKTDVIIANDQAFVATASYIYDVVVISKGQVLFSQKQLSQYPYSNWHKEFWTGTPKAQAFVAFDPEYLAKTGAISEYDFSLGLAQSSITNNTQAQAAAKSGPMNSSLITPWIETTGGRADIGVTTGWAANYLVSQDPAAMAVMLAQADDAGSVPWHLRDSSTNGPIAIDKHSTSWANGGSGTAYGCNPGDCWGSPFDTSAALAQGGWGLDTAHEPDLSFIPYLVTGNHYYLDELESEAAYLTIAQHPAYRQLQLGLFFPTSQERGIAWNMRDVGNAAWIAPDSDPLKATFAGNLANNLTNLAGEIATLHSTAAEGEIEGYLPDGTTGTNMTAPWQNVYVTAVMELQAARGASGAQAIAEWLEPYNSGQYVNGANGFNPFNGPGYWNYVDNGDGVPAGTASQGIKPNTWADFYTFNYGALPVPTVLQNYVNCTYCYPAYTTMASAELFTTTGRPSALWAYAYLIANTSVLLQPTGYVTDPSWHVTPVLPDGYHLKQADIQVVPDAGGTVTATGAHAVLTGGLGTNVLNGGSGWTLMYASSGPATINVGSGTSYIVAGAGELSTKAMINIDAVATAVDTVMDFNPAIDSIVISNAAGLSLAAPTWIASDGAGGSVLTLSPTHKVAMLGVAPTALLPAISLH